MMKIILVCFVFYSAEGQEKPGKRGRKRKVTFEL